MLFVSRKGTRRLVSVTVVVLMALLITVSSPVWLPIVALMDLARRKNRLPTVRLLAFGCLWAWVEVAGLLGLLVLWATGGARTPGPHYALQRRWCAGIISALRVTMGMRLRMNLPEVPRDRPYVVLCRHVSLADSIISCYVVNNTLHLDPRYVLKSDLMAVPCLDILGHRTPNCFVRRGTDRPEDEIAAVAAMVHGMPGGGAAVIFPEGSRANDAKRDRELARLEERHPGRHGTLRDLRHLIPPKPAGAASIVEAAPGADVITVWHHGLDGMDTFGGILREVARRRPVVHVVADLHPRATVPSGDGFVDWLDAQWVRMDAEVAAFVRGS